MFPEAEPEMRAERTVYAFKIHALQAHARRIHDELSVPHNGSDAYRFDEAMRERTQYFINFKYPTYWHACRKCHQLTKDPQTGELDKSK